MWFDDLRRVDAILFVFLLGVGIGFLSFGRAIGEAVGSLPRKSLLLPFGALLERPFHSLTGPGKADPIRTQMKPWLNTTNAMDQSSRA